MRSNQRNHNTSNVANDKRRLQWLKSRMSESESSPWRYNGHAESEEGMLAPRVTTAQTQDESYARTTAQTMWQQAHEGPEPKEAWEAFVEDETGDIYYHNEATNETSWVPPGHWSAAEA